MSKVRWLHISDMHYGYESYVTTEMRTNMLKSLPNILTGEAQPEYLFITGDLRYGKECKSDFPEEIADNIKNLAKSFNILPERIHIAMGNHDVVREFGRTNIAPLLREEYKSKNGSLNNDQMKTLELSQHKFYEIYKSVCERDPVPYHNVIKEKDFNIICLNTSFACSNDDEDGDLIVGMQLLQKELEKIDDSKPGIVIAHHGFESLQHKEREQLEIKLKEKGALLYLCGHEHMADCRNIAYRRENQPLFEYICGTGMDKLPAGQPAEMVVFMGELDTEQKNGYIQAWEWRDRSGAWLPYLDISYKQGGMNGYHYFPKAPEQKIISKPLKEEAMKKYSQYLLYECGEIRLDGMPADDKVGSKALALEKLFIPLDFDKGKYGGLSFFERSSISQEEGESTFQHITNLLDKIENGKWNQYSISDLLDIEHRFLYFGGNKKLTEKEQDDIRSRINTLKDKVRENNSLIPSEKFGFRRVILAGPGGGKTTLLKRLTMAYAFQDRRKDPEIDDDLPDRELLPIWIRCRDIKEKIALSINEIIQGIPLIAEFNPDQQELTTAFCAEVFERIDKGEALILIDGLDEIADTGLRKSFSEKIARFAQFYPKSNIIVTSRIAGFKYVSGGKLGDFPQSQISELNDSDIRLLCRRWHKIIYADREDIVRQANELSETILSHEKIRAIAGSPLLLTTLLLVKRRVGRLPTKRAELYKESVQVLLETWNVEGFEPINLDTALCQLSYVAFEMMRKGIQTIERRELELLLQNVRKEQSWLPSNLESPETFLKRVELRSSLLANRGYGQMDAGFEEEYEFQHLTFQEYLAACAAVYGYYAGVDDNKDSYLDVLDSFYADENKTEVVLLTVALTQQRRDVTYVVNSIINRIKDLDKKKNIANEIITLRNLLIKIVLDEVQLVEETRNKIFTALTEDSLWLNQIPLFRDVLKSNFGEEFRIFLKNNLWDSLLAALDLQTNENDPIGKCVDLIEERESNVEKRKEALHLFDYLLWLMDNYDIKNRLNKDGLLENVSNSLLSIFMNSEDGNEALSSIGCLRGIIDSGVDISLSDGLVRRLTELNYKQGKIGESIRLTETLISDPKNAQGQLCFDSSQEIKKFLLDSLPNVDYSNKKSTYWATVLVGAWSWDKAEEILDEIFVDENNVRDEMKEKLRKIRAVAESEVN